MREYQPQALQAYVDHDPRGCFMAVSPRGQEALLFGVRSAVCLDIDGINGPSQGFVHKDNAPGMMREATYFWQRHAGSELHIPSETVAAAPHIARAALELSEVVPDCEMPIAFGQAMGILPDTDQASPAIKHETIRDALISISADFDAALPAIVAASLGKLRS